MLVGNPKHTQHTAVLSLCTPSEHTALIKWSIKATEKSKKWTELQYCIITCISAQKTSFLSCYTAWNYTSKHIKHSNDPINSHAISVRKVIWSVESFMAAACAGEVPVASEKNFHGLLCVRNGVKFLASICVGAILIAPHRSLLKAVWT